MKSLNLRVCLALLSVTFITMDANALSFRTLQIPNGERMNCIGCHITNTGGARNAFGTQVGDMGLNAGDVVWADVCNLDADGDGYTNGVELGDPNCTWTIGSANPSFAPTNPGLGNMTPCGNGTLEGAEECDGTANLNGMTCVDLELPDGRNRCGN